MQLYLLSKTSLWIAVKFQSVRSALYTVFRQFCFLQSWLVRSQNCDLKKKNNGIQCFFSHFVSIKYWCNAIGFFQVERLHDACYWLGITCTLSFIFFFLLDCMVCLQTWGCRNVDLCQNKEMHKVVFGKPIFFFLFVGTIYVIWEMNLNIVGSEIAWGKNASKTSWKEVVVGLPPNDHCLSAWNWCLLTLM